MSELKHPKETLRKQEAIIVLTIILFAFSSLLTTFRNNSWRDELSIYKDCAEKSPNKHRALCNYGLALIGKGQYDEGISVLEKAMACGKPFYESYFTAASNIIVALGTQGKYSEARKKGGEFFRNMPRNVDTQALPSFLHNLSYVYFKEGEYKLAMEAIKSSLALAHSYDSMESNATISMATTVLLKAYDIPEARLTLGMGDKATKEIAVTAKLAELLLQNRKYQEADQFIKTLKEIAPENPNTIELGNRLESEQDRNRTATKLSAISNHPPYKNDFRYRLCLSAAHFIMYNYRPLRPLVGKILEFARDGRYLNDPFIDLYEIKWEVASTAPDINTSKLTSALEHNPDFVPLLDIASDLYLTMNKNKEALAAYKHLLKLYPGHSRWNILEKFITTLERQNTPQESANAAVASN